MKSRLPLADELALKKLEEGSKITVHYKGISMYPFLVDGDQLVVRKPAEDLLRPGTLLLFQSEGNLIVHRLCKKNGANGNKTYFTRGDACSWLDAPLRREEILGVVEARLRKGEKTNFLRPREQVKAYLSTKIFSLKIGMKKWMRRLLLK